MSEPLDDGLEKLKAFNELLRSSQPALESGGADLARLGRALSDAEGRLSLDLDGLATDVDEVQKEAQASEAAAVEACQDLNDAAETVLTTTIAELEKGAATMQERWTHDLAERATALTGAFQDLQGSGWEPLIAALGNEDAAFDRWTQAADEAIGVVVHQLAGAVAEVEHETTDLTAAADELTGIPLFDQASWNESRDDAETTLHQVLPWFRQSELEITKDLAATHEQLAGAATAAAGHVRAQLDQVAQKAADGLDAEANQLVQSFGEAAEGVERLQVELERGAVQAADTQAAAHRLADLAAQVIDGDATVREIHSVLEAMKEP